MRRARRSRAEERTRYRSDFLSFIVVEHIRFFRGALHLSLYTVNQKRLLLLLLSFFVTNWTGNDSS